MNITELKELAEKATQGDMQATGNGVHKGIRCVLTTHMEPYEQRRDDAAYYAAANPAAILELIAQLEDARTQMERQKDEWLSWEAKRRDLEKAAAQLEDAQGEIRALRATEAGLREKADRWDFLSSRMLAADFDYGGEGVQALVFEMPSGFSASVDAADTIDRARALLEKKE